jgi:hypothetical protein
MQEALGAVLTVCLTVSPGIALDEHERAAMFTEAQTVCSRTALPFAGAKLTAATVSSSSSRTRTRVPRTSPKIRRSDGCRSSPVGRAEDADLHIPLPSVSRHHVRIVVRGLEATLDDLGSRHGSWRGTTRLHGITLLAQGDEIRLGNAVIEHRLVMPRDTTID